ncbi:hypothetical protein ACJZ2D_011883 [Fusarium nematophilum]
MQGGASAVVAHKNGLDLCDSSAAQPIPPSTTITALARRRKLLWRSGEHHEDSVLATGYVNDTISVGDTGSGTLLDGGAKTGWRPEAKSG